MFANGDQDYEIRLVGLGDKESAYGNCDPSILRLIIDKGYGRRFDVPLGTQYHAFWEKLEARPPR